MAGRSIPNHPDRMMKSGPLRDENRTGFSCVRSPASVVDERNLSVLADTSFLTFLWSLIVIFFMVIFFLLLFQVLGDLIRRHDTTGFRKAVWIIALVLLPYVGVLSYYIVNGGGMAERAMQSQQHAEQAFQGYVRDAAGTAGPTDQIAKAKTLLDTGAINQAEYEALKAKAMAA
jgi:ABC-type multidrug transport system fused ATPase/permease subunit